MDVVRVMTVGVLGGLLGILMMIPLRRAFIVRQHRTLTYPEGTACAEVLIVGEEGGSTAKTVFAGFGLAFCYKLASSVLKLWIEAPTRALYNDKGQGLPARSSAASCRPSCSAWAISSARGWRRSCWPAACSRRWCWRL